MTTRAFIFAQPGADPGRDRVVLDGGGQRTILVPVPDGAAVAAVARALVADDGVGLIELGGGFGRATATGVAAAVTVPVGHVAFAADPSHGAATDAERFTAEQAHRHAGLIHYLV